MVHLINASISKAKEMAKSYMWSFYGYQNSDRIIFGPPKAMALYSENDLRLSRYIGIYAR